MAGRIRCCARSWRRSLAAQEITVCPQLDSAIHSRRDPPRAPGRHQPCLSKPSAKTGCRLWLILICTALRKRGALPWTDSRGFPRWVSRLISAAEPPQPWSGPTPTQILAVPDPGTTPVHPLLRCYWRLPPAAENSVGVSDAILRSRTTTAPPQRRWAAARPLQNEAQKQVAPGGDPLMGAPPREAHLE